MVGSLLRMINKIADVGGTTLIIRQFGKMVEPLIRAIIKYSTNKFPHNIIILLENTVNGKDWEEFCSKMDVIVDEYPTWHINSHVSNLQTITMLVAGLGAEMPPPEYQYLVIHSNALTNDVEFSCYKDQDLQEITDKIMRIVESAKYN